MMLKTYSAFYYGIEVTEFNRFLDFQDADGNWTAKLDLGGYTLTQVAKEVRRAMNASGTSKRYLVSVDRVTRKIKIKSQDLSNFSLRFGTGPNASLSCASLLGFPASNTASLNEHESTDSIGKVYKPQFFLQNYLPPEMNKTPIGASVNTSASGRFVEVIGYNENRVFRFDIRFITNEPQASGSLIKNNQNAIEDTLDFLDYVTNGNAIEFMPNESDPYSFYQGILISTSSNS
ncbi:MAG: hypothetical protein WHU54_09485, partial [Candidatus Bathyarchaeia archaeon]